MLLSTALFAGASREGDGVCRRLTRRSVLRSSLSRLPRPGTLARPYIANAQATTAEVWFAARASPKKEDIALKKLVAEYEKASGNKIDLQHHPVRAAAPEGGLGDPRAASSRTSWRLPTSNLRRCNAWDDKLVDVSDIVEAQKEDFIPIAVDSCFLYNSVTKTARLLHGADEDHRLAVPYLAVAGREGRVQDLGSFRTPGMLSSTSSCRCRTSLRGAGHAQHLRLWLSADRQRRRPDRHLQRLPDRLWRQGPRHAGRQARTPTTRRCARRRPRRSSG